MESKYTDKDKKERSGKDSIDRISAQSSSQKVFLEETIIFQRESIYRRKETRTNSTVAPNNQASITLAMYVCNNNINAFHY